MNSIMNCFVILALLVMSSFALHQTMPAIASIKQQLSHRDLTYVERKRPQFEALSVPGNANVNVVSKRIAKKRELIAALESYKKIEGNLAVPQMFCVPNAEPWPHGVRGMKLGVRVATVRTRYRKNSAWLKSDPVAAELKSQLDRMGFIWRVYKKKDDKE